MIADQLDQDLPIAFHQGHPFCQTGVVSVVMKSGSRRDLILAWFEGIEVRGDPIDQIVHQGVDTDLLREIGDIFA